MNPRALEQLAMLASYLAERREAILTTWKEAVDADPGLRTASTLSLTHFRDMLPIVLASFEHRLRLGASPPVWELEESPDFREHGRHRWQQGYPLHELIREWAHIQLVVLNELESYSLAHPELAPEVMPFARRAWVQVCSAGTAASVGRYFDLQQAEAEGIVRDLENAKQLERRRTEAWYEAAHDLRGNVGVLTMTASILTEDGVPETLRSKAVSLLQSSVSSLHSLLEDLLSLARLEAGREQRKVETFDAAAKLRELCSSLEPLAHERALFLETQGPAPLIVEGDAAKVLRIVQNLALNALRYTRSGGVVVSWGETWESDTERWLIRVQDTGPGLHFAPAAPIALELNEATAEARVLEERAGREDVEPVPEAGSPPPPSPPFRQHPGEGIGLSIVKRLCELLDAGLDIASTPQGTTFQVVLPRRYGAGPAEREPGQGVFGAGPPG